MCPPLLFSERDYELVLHLHEIFGRIPHLNQIVCAWTFLFVGRFKTMNLTCLTESYSDDLFLRESVLVGHVFRGHGPFHPSC